MDPKTNYPALNHEKGLVLLLSLLLAVLASYSLGRKSIKPMPQDTFYASVEQIYDSWLRVQGLEINDINKRWKFDLFLDEDTEILWRNVPITISDLKEGDLISITYTGLIAETSPAQISQVLRIQALGDDIIPSETPAQPQPSS